jgi:hypothetical protein
MAPCTRPWPGARVLIAVAIRQQPGRREVRRWPISFPDQARPNSLGPNLYPASQSISKWFNTADFTAPTPFTFGTLGRNVLFGPGQRILDIGVIKDTRINERFQVQFRAEAFNLPNHPIFSNPAANISVASTAGVIGSTAVDSRSLQFALKLLL